MSALLGLLGNPLPALAETVLLTRGGGEHGLGWLFRHTDGSCRIATPRHVIERDDGSLVPPDMLDRFGDYHTTAEPVAAPDPERDLAFLTVSGRLADEGCTSSRLSAVSLTAAISRMNAAYLSVATPFDRQQIQIEQRAAARDEGGGIIVAIAPVAGAEPLRKGMSGGAVMFENRPVAMLTNVDTDFGIGVALRFDVIASELAALSDGDREPSAASPSDIRELILVDGTVARTDASVAAFSAGMGELALSPNRERVTLIIDLGELRSVTEVRLEGALTDGQPEALIVEASSGSTGFMPASRCFIGASVAWLCSFSARHVDRLRVTIPTQDPMVTLRSIAVR